MSIALITGSSGLIGSEAARFFHSKGFDVVGIDNGMRSYFFGSEGSVDRVTRALENELRRFSHNSIDIRNQEAIRDVFSRYSGNIGVVIHTAAQPSHDWAAKEPFTDFGVNALGTLNLLEATREFCPEAPFIFTSTNKVYGDTPNFLPLVERETRWEVDEQHEFAAHGIDESMSIDESKHSIFGVSKVAADVMTQEYGRYFGLKTGVFRGGCLTGPAHSGAKLHGFLAYLVKCVVNGAPYVVNGYKGKQVRDNIHSNDLVRAFWEFFQNPKHGRVYNIGGSRHSNCSVLEAIDIAEEITGKRLRCSISDTAREGDHIWWVSDVRRFKRDYPAWTYEHTLRSTIEEIAEASAEKRREWSVAKVQTPRSASRPSKQNVLGVGVDAIDYDSAVERVFDAARSREPLAVTALAVHGVMTGALDSEHRHRLNNLDLVVPDGHPVRWAIGLLHGIKLSDRVYGPELMLRVCERAAIDGHSIYLYGSTSKVLESLSSNLRERFQGLQIAGSMPSRFRTLSDEEQVATAKEIAASGASIVFVGLGCPRQETWVFEHRNLLDMPTLAVGAAFDFHAGVVRQAPAWFQRNGFEWLYRFAQEPRRLWKRYTVLNALYIGMVGLQYLQLRTRSLSDTTAPTSRVRFG